MLKKLSNFLNDGAEKTRDKNFISRKNSAIKTNADVFDFLDLIKSWPSIVGPKMSEFTIPLRNQNGNLIILSNHSMFASEMKYMELPLKKKIFEVYPKLEAHIKTLTFIVDSTHFEKQKEVASIQTEKNKEKVSLPHPYSPQGKTLQKEANELFIDVTDEEMKEALTSLYVQNKFNSKS